MDKETLRSAYERVIDGKLATHVTAATATGINVESLKKFKTGGSLHADKRAVLYEWMERQGFFDARARLYFTGFVYAGADWCPWIGVFVGCGVEIDGSLPGKDLINKWLN